LKAFGGNLFSFRVYHERKHEQREVINRVKKKKVLGAKVFPSRGNVCHIKWESYAEKKGLKREMGVNN